jgi:EPS-associated MarR family transcriptional regulator
MPGSPLASSDEHHLRLLRLIEAYPEASQRELARELGVSLGKAHYLVRALLEKGLVKAGDFRRHDKKLAYAYLLTPKGATEKLRLARVYLARKEREYEAIRAEIEQLRKEVPA